MMTDWGVHLLDIVQWAMGVDAPEKISADGGKFILTDNRETPDTLTATFHYRDFICTYENRTCNARRINDHGYGIEFYGTEGTLFLDRGGFQITPERNRQQDRTTARMYAMQEENRNDHGRDHVRNFLDCVRSRSAPVSDIEKGHRSTTTCLLANISYRTGRQIRWDSAAETILDDQDANRWLERDYRPPWKL
jgi:predicted dehydrogenase